MPKKIYIAGPMRGRKFYNFPAFDAAEERLRRLGYDVVNPAALDRARGIQPENFPEDWDWNQVPEGFNLREVALKCMWQLSSCDGVLLLEYWYMSRGAKSEFYFSNWLKLPCAENQGTDSAIVAMLGDST